MVVSLKVDCCRLLSGAMPQRQALIAEDGQNGRMEGWKRGRVEDWKKQRAGGSPRFQPATLSNLPLALGDQSGKKIRAAHAKEVGVGNPSEERATTRIK